MPRSTHSCLVSLVAYVLAPVVSGFQLLSSALSGQYRTTVKVFSASAGVRRPTKKDAKSAPLTRSPSVLLSVVMALFAASVYPPSTTLTFSAFSSYLVVSFAMVLLPTLFRWNSYLRFSVPLFWTVKVS